MKDLRLWMVVLAASFFLAGTATGLLMGERRRGGERSTKPFADYVELLTEHFQLEPERRALLEEIMRFYAEDIEETQRQHHAALAPHLKDEIEQHGKRCRERIRNQLLDADERAEYHRLALGQPQLP